MNYLIPPLPESVKLAQAAGDFRLARTLIRKFLAGPLPPALRARLEFEPERLERLRKAYPYDRPAALRLLKASLKNFRSSELDGWIKKGFCSPRVIDGVERFQDCFASNIVFCEPKLKRRRKVWDKTADASLLELMNRVDALAAGARPARYRVRARLTAELKAPPREKVRCWLPFPRVGEQVAAARLTASSHKARKLAPPGAPQRTIYFEGKDRKFWAEFEYVISEWVTPSSGSNRIPPAVRRYLAEEPPHLIFTPYIRGLARSIVGKEKNNYRKARRIYAWLTANLSYNFTLPYGAVENISGQCLADLRGDCGFQALAFITLCRAAGVPARWQSGWVARPGKTGMHDWALFYAGSWRPADISFGADLRREGEEKRRWFYFGGLDAGRLVANADFGAPLQPAKKHWRSDPTDNQAGEMETARGNLYLDRFRTRLELLDFKKL